MRTLHLQVGSLSRSLPPDWKLESPTDLFLQVGAAGRHFSSASSPLSTSLLALPHSPAPMQPLPAPGCRPPALLFVFVDVVIGVVVIAGIVMVNLLECLVTLTCAQAPGTELALE